MEMNESIVKILRGIISDLDENAQLSFEGHIGAMTIPCEDYYHAMGVLDTLYTLFQNLDEDDEDNDRDAIEK